MGPFLQRPRKPQPIMKRHGVGPASFLLRGCRPLGSRRRPGRYSVRSGAELRPAPELLRHRRRIDLHPCPPGAFISTAMQLAVVGAAEGHGKFVADLAAERSRLREAEMV